MRTAHKFDWHHAPEHGPISAGDYSDPRHNSYQKWCQWCGMRYVYHKTPTMDELPVWDLATGETMSRSEWKEKYHTEFKVHYNPDGLYRVPDYVGDTMKIIK